MIKVLTLWSTKIGTVIFKLLFHLCWVLFFFLIQHIACQWCRCWFFCCFFFSPKASCNYYIEKLKPFVIPFLINTSLVSTIPNLWQDRSSNKQPTFLQTKTHLAMSSTQADWGLDGPLYTVKDLTTMGGSFMHCVSQNCSLRHHFFFTVFFNSCKSLHKDTSIIIIFFWNTLWFSFLLNIQNIEVFV